MEYYGKWEIEKHLILHRSNILLSSLSIPLAAQGLTKKMDIDNPNKNLFLSVLHEIFLQETQVFVPEC